MKKIMTVTSGILFFSNIALGANEKLTVEQCISILTGLNALNCVGQQLGGQCEKDAKQYKLGEARYTIAMDIAALGPVLSSVQEAQRKYIGELPALPPIDSSKGPSPQYNEKAAEQQKLIAANQAALLAKACNVQPGHLKLFELKLGDGPDQNPIPPSVLAAFGAIVDK